jgi:hypothetical protein
LQKKFTESVLHSEEILNNPKIKEHIAWDNLDTIMKWLEFFEIHGMGYLLHIFAFVLFFFLVDRISKATKLWNIQWRKKKYSKASMRNIQSYIQNSLNEARKRSQYHALLPISVTCILLYMGRALNYKQVREISVLKNSTNTLTITDLKKKALELWYVNFKKEMSITPKEWWDVSYTTYSLRNTLVEAWLFQSIRNQIIANAKKNWYSIPEDALAKITENLVSQSVNNIYQEMWLEAVTILRWSVKDWKSIPRTKEEYLRIIYNEISKINEIKALSNVNITSEHPLQTSNYYSYIILLSIILWVSSYLFLDEFKSANKIRKNKKALYSQIEQQLDDWLNNPTQSQDDLLALIEHRLWYQDWEISQIKKRYDEFQQYKSTRVARIAPFFGNETIFTDIGMKLCDYLEWFWKLTQKQKIHVVINVTLSNNIDLDDRCCSYIRDFIKRNCDEGSKVEFFVYGVPFNGWAEQQYFTNVWLLKALMDESAVDPDHDEFLWAYELAILRPLALEPIELPETYTLGDQWFDGRIIVGSPDTIPNALKEKHPGRAQDVKELKP